MIGSNSNSKLGLSLNKKVNAVKAPTRVEDLLHCQITQVSCGSEYTLALTTTGIVYAWGQNLQGALGVQSAQGLIETQVNRPCAITQLTKHCVV